MACSARPTGKLFSDFQLGTASLNASQPDPSGFGISTSAVEVGSAGCSGTAGSAYAVTANGTEKAIAAIPAVAPRGFAGASLHLRLLNSDRSPGMLRQFCASAKAVTSPNGRCRPLTCTLRTCPHDAANSPPRQRRAQRRPARLHGRGRGVHGIGASHPQRRDRRRRVADRRGRRRTAGFRGATADADPLAYPERSAAT